MSWTIRVCSTSFARSVNADVTTSSVTTNICHTEVQLAAKSTSGGIFQNDAERIAQKVVSALLG